MPWRYGVFLGSCLAAAPFAAITNLLTGAMLGFDLAALVFIATLPPLFRQDDDAMRRHARDNDANRTLILIVTGIVMVVVLVAVAGELREKEAPHGGMILLILATLAIAWLFSNLVYALHYAYLFYRGDGRGSDRGGIDFPGRQQPGYWDFAYFAFTLGMTFQTSDVAVTAPDVRRVVLFQCLAAFVFNLGIIAFTINILGSG